MTASTVPDMTADDALAASVLRRRGAEVCAVPWDDPGVAWGRFDAIVLRSCWNYHRAPAAFAAWLDRLDADGTPVWNRPDLVRWNMDKRYLRDLEARGVSIPPTAWVDRGTVARLADVLADTGFRDAVVKPTVSATAWRTWRTGPGAAARQQEAFEELLAASGALVQAFVPEIALAGEWSLVFFDGEFSHAVLKRAAAGDFRVQSDFGGTAVAGAADPALVAQAAHALACAGPPPLYARIDGVDVNGRFVLIELELIEPVLFLDAAPEAAVRFAAAIDARVRTMGSSSGT